MSSAKARLAAQMTEEKVKEARAEFAKADTNGDGFITANELKGIMLKEGCPEEDVAEVVQGMLDEMDENRDGKVSFEEFLKVFVAEESS